jgi:hypothetical protein
LEQKVKVETAPQPFRPVTITLETHEELIALRFMLLTIGNADLRDNVRTASGKQIISPDYAAEIRERLQNKLTSNALGQ